MKDKMETRTPLWSPGWGGIHFQYWNSKGMQDSSWMEARHNIMELHTSLWAKRQ